MAPFRSRCKIEDRSHFGHLSGERRGIPDGADACGHVASTTPARYQVGARRPAGMPIPCATAAGSTGFVLPEARFRSPLGVSSSLGRRTRAAPPHPSACNCTAAARSQSRGLLSLCGATPSTPLTTTCYIYEMFHHRLGEIGTIGSLSVSPPPWNHWLPLAWIEIHKRGQFFLLVRLLV